MSAPEKDNDLQSLLQGEQISLAAKDLTYTVTDRKRGGRLTIVKNVNLLAKPGQVLAIMGGYAHVVATNVLDVDTHTLWGMLLLFGMDRLKSVSKASVLHAQSDFSALFLS